jgi:hypothetical protein
VVYNIMVDIKMVKDKRIKYSNKSGGKQSKNICLSEQIIYLYVKV